MRFITFDSVSDLVAELNRRLNAKEFLEVIHRCGNLQQVREYRKSVSAEESRK